MSIHINHLNSIITKFNFYGRKEERERKKKEEKERNFEITMLHRNLFSV